MLKRAHPRLLLLCLTPGLCLLGAGGGNGRATDPSPKGPETLDKRFTSAVKPFVERYCLSCHGAKSPRAKLDLSRFATATDVATDLRRWEQVLDKLQSGDMPPEDAP